MQPVNHFFFYRLILKKKKKSERKMFYSRYEQTVELILSHNKSAHIICLLLPRKHRSHDQFRPSIRHPGCRQILLCVVQAVPCLQSQGNETQYSHRKLAFGLCLLSEILFYSYFDLRCWIQHKQAWIRFLKVFYSNRAWRFEGFPWI